MKITQKRYLGFMLVCLLGVAGYYVIRTMLPSAGQASVEVISPVRGEFVIGLLVEGALESEDALVIRTGKAPGELTMLAQDGSIIKQGDVFCRINARDLERSRIDAELAYKQAQEEIDRSRQSATENYENDQRELERVQQQLRTWEEEVATRIEQDESQLEYDRAELSRLEAEYQRTMRMVEKGYLPASDAELRKAASDAQRFKVTQSEKDIELNRVSIDSERRQKQSVITTRERRVKISFARIDGQGSYFAGRLARAQARLQSVEAALAESTIIAPVSGTVTLFSTYRGGERRPWREGDTVGTGASIGSISGNQVMIVRCRVKENNIAALRNGLQAEMIFDAVPNARFKGMVSSVGLVAREIWVWEDPTAEGNERVFDVQVSVTNGPTERLKAGLNGQVTIIQQRLPDKLSVPLSAVFTKSGKSYVYVKKESAFLEHEVQTGERNDRAVVIESGLTGDEQIALANPSTANTGGKKRKRT